MTVAINGRDNDRYANYKPSDDAWLGTVPSHWGLPRTKWVFSERVEKGFPDEPPLAATQTMGVVRKDRYENRTVLALKDLHLLKLVHKGDFVISLRSFQGGIECAHDRGIISPAYTILRPYPRNVVNGYFTYLLKSAPYIENLKLHVTGIRQGQNIDYAKLSRSKIPLPPLQEQRTIARYLDYMDGRIQRYIRAKERLIELLEEQKRAAINQAVTRGLDPDVPLKPSGVEWLGDVPAHWEVAKATRLFSVGSGTTPPTGRADFYGGDVPWITTSELRETIITATKKNVNETALREFPALRVYPRDSVAVAMYGATIGRVGYIGVPATVNQACCVFSNPKGINTWYFFYWLQACRPDLISLGYGGGQPNLSQELLKSLRVTKPPLGEQAAIVELLDENTVKIKSSIRTTRRQIELIKEYRTRLIADVVTGKLDVREAAAILPDVDDEDELSDLGDDSHRLELAEVG